MVIVPRGHVLLAGEPRAGRSDVIEGLRRVLSPASTRVPINDDLDFFLQDRAFRAEVEVVLGDLGPDLTQQFFDRLEFWNEETSTLVDELETEDALTDDTLEPVVRLCYRAEWSTIDEYANHWVDYPKTSDPDANDFDRVRRADREALPFFSVDVGERPLALTARTIFRRLVDNAPGDDFATHLESLVEEVREAAENLGHSTQVQAALEEALRVVRAPLRTETVHPNDVVRFVPGGGTIGALLRSIAPTVDVRDGAGFLPLGRHGSSLSALLSVSEVLAIGGRGVIAVDDFGEDLDAASARYLAAAVARQVDQAWIATRRPAVAEAFKTREIVRLAFDDAGARVAFPGWEPVGKAERMFARHLALQILPNVAARSIVAVEGPHDRLTYGLAASRLFDDSALQLPAATQIAFADAGAADGSGGSSALPRLAAGARKLGFFVVAILDGDKDPGVIANVSAEADGVVRLPDGFAVERAIVDGLDDDEVRQALATLDVDMPAGIEHLGGRDLHKVVISALKKQGGLHSQFIDGLSATTHPPLIRRVLECVIEACAERRRGLVQL